MKQRPVCRQPELPCHTAGMTPASLHEEHIVPALAGVKKKTSSMLTYLALYLEQDGDNHPKTRMLIL